MMSTQNDMGIPLSNAPDSAGYRLMELPPDLLEALESDHPPELVFESSDASAVLKHGSKSWSLRQKNTSNALILLRPAMMNAESSEIPQPGLEMISTIHDTVELVAEAADKPKTVEKGKWHEKFASGR
ncbi:hypothetical protein F5Y16DRAFT_354542 [Xylariaceae sp. FL0255]|nr:hypothetical protein F5Y16DRAFT_354542 [Xylariaceae sp. FL0255]